MHPKPRRHSQAGRDIGILKDPGDMDFLFYPPRNQHQPYPQHAGEKIAYSAQLLLSRILPVEGNGCTLDVNYIKFNFSKIKLQICT